MCRGERGGGGGVILLVTDRVMSLRDRFGLVELDWVSASSELFCLIPFLFDFGLVQFCLVRSVWCGSSMRKT